MSSEDNIQQEDPNMEQHRNDHYGNEYGDRQLNEEGADNPAREESPTPLTEPAKTVEPPFLPREVVFGSVANQLAMDSEFARTTFITESAVNIGIGLMLTVNQQDKIVLAPEAILTFIQNYRMQSSIGRDGNITLHVIPRNAGVRT